MTRIIVKQLIWEKWTKEHIKKHNVTLSEAEEAAKKQIAHRWGYKGRYILFGRSGLRILAVIVTRKAGGEYFLVTCRDADKGERRRVYEKETN